MAQALPNQTYDISIKAAKFLTALVEQEWKSGRLLEGVSPVTEELLRYWFNRAPSLQYEVRFHKGQREAILNVVYCHEVLAKEGLLARYQMLAGLEGSPVSAEDIEVIRHVEVNHPKYCMNMATGTGKTWVMNALLIWQYLNAKAGIEGNYTKNFLIMAPGLVVYDRMLDTLLGKKQRNDKRNYETADLKQHEELFLPPPYREPVQAFVQAHVVVKKKLKKRNSFIAGGLIAVTNWHTFLDRDEDEEEEEALAEVTQEPDQIVKALLPITPGKTAGHALGVLDKKLTSGTELAQLTMLESLCVFNDEAHHLHEQKIKGEVAEVIWQTALRQIAETKGVNFIQCDFSATPYTVTGSGQKRKKHYFPHIINDFNLREAITERLVKLLIMDKRKEVASLSNDEIEFQAVRSGGAVIRLSDGQRLMLRAGLKRLSILEAGFRQIKEAKNKYPKMMVVCEQTEVAEFVCDFLLNEGCSKEDLLHIDSERKSQLGEKKWKAVEQRLSSFDKGKKPRIIVSVLMLREGFDVNNICVIVPLRSSESSILLEQVIGRGLRLMWREPQYQLFKEANYKRVIEQKKNPISDTGFYDMLFVIEHPKYLKFYEDLEDGLFGNLNEEITVKQVVGRLIASKLKSNYSDYDLYMPEIIEEQEEILVMPNVDITKLKPFSGNLKELQAMLPKSQEERFVGEEKFRKTRFGEYRVTTELFNASSYNEYLQRILRTLLDNFVKPTPQARNRKVFPFLQVQEHQVMGLLDVYIRTRLFDEPFNPMLGNNWRVLMIVRKGITDHIIQEFYKVVGQLQKSVEVTDAKVRKRYFSEQSTLMIDERYALRLEKTIYDCIAYPSNKGEFEREFMEFLDKEAEVISFIKITPHYHDFARISYIPLNGFWANYYTDFMVRLEGDVYLVETKAEDFLSEENVQRKRQSVLEWLEKVNALKPEQRMNVAWHYVILGDKTFAELREKRASIRDMLEFSKWTNEHLKRLRGELF